MNILRLAAAAAAMLLTAACADGRDTLGPTAPAQARAAAVSSSASRQVQASGLFDAIVDFRTLSLTPRGSNCLLQVDGQLVFHGTIEGVANGTTTALVFATCEDVASKPPGTDPDVFQSRATFQGTVDGEPATAKLLYAGRVQPGGHIDGRLVFSDGLAGKLDASSQVAVGGEYSGSVVVH